MHIASFPPSALRSIPAVRENGASNRSMNERHSAAENQGLRGLDDVELPRTYRVYFNSKADAPNCWSIDDGTIATEIVVASIQLNGVDAISRLNLAANNLNDPRAWFEVYGTLSVVNSHAVIAGV
jgi:hypothetical protein